MVEIIPRPVENTPLWQSLILYFSIALVIASVLSYFYLDNIQKKSSAVLENMEQTLAKEITPEEKVTRGDVLNYQAKIKDFGILLNNHEMDSKFFNLLDASSHPKVQITELNLDLAKHQAVVTGLTDSFQTLGQQLIIFRNEKKFIGVSLPDILIGEAGKVKFSFLLDLSPDLFK